MAGFCCQKGQKIVECGMARSHKLVHGVCQERKIEVSDDRACDYFVPKRKSRYRVCCRNCRHFEPNETLVEEISETRPND